MALYDDDAAQELDSPIGVTGVSRGGAGRSMESDGPGYWYQSSTGGTVAAIAGPVSVKAHGATGDGTTDDTAAIQAALTVALAGGLPLYFPATSAHYSVTSASGPIFAVTKPIRIYGDGKASYIKATAGTATTVDIFEYDPASNADTDYVTFENLRMGGTAGSARRGIFFDATGSGEFIRKYLIRRIWMDSLGGSCIYLDATNSGGGFGIFTGIIDDVWLEAYGAGAASCIRGINLFDSNVVQNSSLTGTGYGLNVSFLPASGVGIFKFDNNSVTASGGATFGTGCNKLIIKDSFFELGVTFTGTNTALLDIDGAGSGSPYLNAVIENTIFAVQSPQVADCLRLNYVSAAVVDKCQFGTVTGRSGITVTANAARTQIRFANEFTGAGTAISNSSASTIGDSVKLYAAIADSSAIANTTTPTEFSKTYSIPADLLLPGDVIELQAQGIHSTTGTPTLKLEFLIGGFTFGQDTKTTASGASNAIWTIQTRAVVRTIGASGNFRSSNQWYGLAGSSFGPLVGQLLTAINTTAAIACAVRATWSAADPANTVTMQSLNITLHRGGVSN